MENGLDHGMQQQRQPAGSKSNCPERDAPQLEYPMSGLHGAQRRSRRFVPFCLKDECYWMKRQKNNEAARKSRKKRQNNDLILSQKVLFLLQENFQLRKDLLAIKLKYNEVDPEEVLEVHRKVKDANKVLGGTPDISLANYDVPHAQEGLQSASVSAQFIPLPDGEQKLLTEVVKSLILHPRCLEANETNELVFNICTQLEKEDPDGKNESDSTCGVIRREAGQCSLGHMSSQCSTPSPPSTSFSSSSSGNGFPVITSSTIADTQTLQNFVHTSWRKPSEQYKSSTSSANEAQIDVSCLVSDYSSFSNTNSSKSNTPQSSLNNEESYVWSSTDDKGHLKGLPYKLRFKLSCL